MDHNKITYFGLTSFRNQKKRFGIKQDDRRRHFYTIGKTGMGKSNLMENMAIQDIQNGNGIAYVDPHGEGAEKLLDFIPEDRIKDVIFLNPADLDFPIAFNVMEKVDFKYRHLVAGGLMAVFKKVWPDVWSARMEYILNNAILALLEYPDSTLLGVNRILADPEYRKEVVSKVQDPIVRSFWLTEYARYTQRYEIEATAAIQNKVGQFVSNALIRNIIGQTKSTINMRNIMDEGKILILDLSKGRIGEDNSRLLGALLITKIQLAAMSRVDVPEASRRDFYLYVDEFQNFATESFANILSEARKYRLNLIVGHQYISQMDEVVRDAVFGNVGTLAVFRVGAEDGEFLEKEFSPEFTAEDLVNLSKYNIYLKLMIDGVASHPFSAGTLPPPLALEHSNRDKIIQASRDRYGVTKEIVEAKIQDWTQGGMMQDSVASPKKPGEIIRPRVESVSTSVSSLGEPPILYDAICSVCGKPTKTIFEPQKGRPVYCKSCLKKIKSAALPKVSEAPKPQPVVEIPKPAPLPPTPPQPQTQPKPAPQPQIQPQAQPQSQVRVQPPSQPQPPVPPQQVINQVNHNTFIEDNVKIQNISFSAPKRNSNPAVAAPQQNFSGQSLKPKRKEINLADLKKTLEESLSRDAESKQKSEAVQKPPASNSQEVKKPDADMAKQEDDAKKGLINPGQKVNL